MDTASHRCRWWRQSPQSSDRGFTSNFDTTPHNLEAFYATPSCSNQSLSVHPKPKGCESSSNTEGKAFELSGVLRS